MATGFHGLHVIGGPVAFIFLLIRTTLSKFTPAQATAAIVVSYYWHFCRHRGSPVRHHLLHPLAHQLSPVSPLSRESQMSTSPPRTSDIANDEAAASGRLGQGPAKRVPPRSGTVRCWPDCSPPALSPPRSPGRAPGRGRRSRQPVAGDDRRRTQLYDTSCISCHGSNLQGVEDRGPSLIGVGDAAVYFQVSSGRMPAARNEAQVTRKPAKFTEAQITQLGKFVQSIRADRRSTTHATPTGRSRQMPTASRSWPRSPCAGRTSAAAASSSASTARRATTSPAAVAHRRRASSPQPDPANEQQIYTRPCSTGPQNMPKFSNRQLSPRSRRTSSVYRYFLGVHPARRTRLGRVRPVSEGMVMWVVGIGAIVTFAMWMGSRT